MDSSALRAAVVALNETRMNVVSQLNNVLDETAGRERSAEEKEKIARLDARIDEIDAEVRSLVAREQRENEAGQLRETYDHLFGEQRVENREKREADMLRAWLRGEVKGELEVDIWSARNQTMALRNGASPEEIRAMNWQTSSGSLVVPTTLANSLYQYLEAGIAGFRIGASVVNTTSGEPIQFPKLTAHAIAAGSIPQGTAITGTDPTFGRVQLDSYKYGQLVAVSSELVSDAAFDISSWLGRDIGRGMSRLIDTDLVIGAGSANPTGMTILAGSGTNAPVKTGGSLITPTYEKFVDTVYSVNDAYRAEGAAWLVKDSSAGTMRKLRDGAGGTVGAVMWEPSLTNGIQGGQPDRFLGAPVYTDPNCATQGSNATFATYGWFGEYVIRTVGNPVIEQDNSVYFATDQVAFRGKWRVDGDHLDVGALNNLVMNV